MNGGAYSYPLIDPCPGKAAQKLFRAAAETLLSISPSLSPKCTPKASQMPPAFNLGARAFPISTFMMEKQVLSDQVDDASVVDRKHGNKIGIYNPAQRKALLVRFAEKRKRRHWRKKVRYSCRKNLADTRVRVKGRFVKKAPGAPTQRASALPVS
jgi:hypothetical protein